METSHGAHAWRSSARNLLLNDKVAIKKISNCFENVVDAKRTLREIKLVRHLNHGMDRGIMQGGDMKL